jgi:hypothetical protein
VSDEQRTWSGTIRCGCGNLAVLLRGPVHLFVRRETMLRTAIGNERPFTEDEQGRLICSRCGQEIIARRSGGDGERA